MDKAQEDRERRTMLLSAAGFIGRFYEDYSVKGIYEAIISRYEMLLSIIEDRETAIEISHLIRLPVEEVVDIAESTIARLLFNKGNDPFVSLGLRYDASLEEARQRWKRLIVLYHPDKHNASGIYDDKAKRINEAYAAVGKKKKEAIRIADRNVYAGSKRETRRMSSKAKLNSLYAQRGRYLPLFILSLVIMIAVSMLSFCITKVVGSTP